MGNFTQAKRRELAAKGWAMPDGSYPIETRTDLAHAVSTVGLGGAARGDIVAHIKKQAKRLGASASLPAEWSIEDFHQLDDDHALDLWDTEARAREYAAADALAEHLAREDGLNVLGTWGADLHGAGLAKPGVAHLTEYWTHGKGAAEIGWGTHDSMKRCIRHLTEKKIARPGGLCADYHKIATGEWPTEHGKAGIPS